MHRTSSKELHKQHQIARDGKDTGLAPEPPPLSSTSNRLAPATIDHGAGACADGHDRGHRPGDVAALTGENGGGTSGNHGNGTAG